MKAKHIVMSGYYGFDNAGDEAVLSSIIQTLRNLEPDLEITVLSGNPPKTMKEHGVQAIDRNHLAEVWKLLQSADMLISGGGSLLQDVTGPFTIPYYLGIIHMAKLARKPVVVYAQGIGPVQRKAYQRWIGYLFKKLDYISVRDPQSKQLLMEWKLSPDAIDEVVDPVLLLESEGVEAGLKLLQQEGIQFSKPPILVSVRHWREAHHDFQQIAIVCDHLIEAGEEILFLPMHDPEDVKASAEVVALMKNPAKVLAGKYTPSQLIDIVATGKLLIGMRLHALIFAAAREIPCVGISYDPKIDAFLRLLGQEPRIQSGNIVPEVLIDEIYQYLRERDQKIEQLTSRVRRLKEKAERPAKKAIEILYHKK